MWRVERHSGQSKGWWNELSRHNSPNEDDAEDAARARFDIEASKLTTERMKKLFVLRECQNSEKHLEKWQTRNFKKGIESMLVLTRKPKERLRIGDDITVTVLKIGPNKVRLGIDAPRCMKIEREEPDSDHANEIATKAA